MTVTIQEASACPKFKEGDTIIAVDMPSDRARNHLSLIGAKLARVDEEGVYDPSVPTGHIIRAEVTAYLAPHKPTFFRVQYEILFTDQLLEVVTPLEVFRKFYRLL